MLRTLVNLNSNNEMRTLEEMFESLLGTPSRTNPHLSGLPVDITEHDNALFIRASVPGVEPADLNIAIEKNVLSIRGEHRQETFGENEKVYRRELSYGAFARSIRLPEGLDLENVSADFKNGFVTISLPRLPEEKPKAIKINVRTSETSPVISPAETPTE